MNVKNGKLRTDPQDLHSLIIIIPISAKPKKLAARINEKSSSVH